MRATEPENDPGDFGTKGGADTGGSDVVPPEGCFPEIDDGLDDTGGEDLPPEGQAQICVGQAFGIFRYSVCDTLGCVANAEGADETPTAGCFPLNPEGNLQDLAEDMCPMPLELPASPEGLGGIPTPQSCCTEATPEGNVIESCRQDCAIAACQLAANVFAQQAQEQENANAAADLQFFSDIFDVPANFQLCVDRVLAGEVIDLGDGVENTNEAGDIVDATLELTCDITGTQPVDTRDGCSQTPNSGGAPAGGPGGGVILGGLMTNVPGQRAAIRVEPCSADVCGVQLRGAELIPSHLLLGLVHFDQRGARLAKTAIGTRDGEEIVFRELVVEMTVEVAVFGWSLGSSPITLSSRGEARGQIIVDDQLGSRTRVFTIDLEPMVFDRGDLAR